MIFQHSAAGRDIGIPALLRLWPFWLVLLAFESVLWLLLAVRFGQPCAPVALAVGLTFGVGAQMVGARGLRGALWAAVLTAVTVSFVLYAWASLHVARVFGLDPWSALKRTGSDFAFDVLTGLLTRGDWLFVAAGLLLALIVGHGWAAGRVGKTAPRGSMSRSDP